MRDLDWDWPTCGGSIWLMALPEPLAAQLRTKRRSFRAMVVAWARANSRTYPWRLPGRQPYEILVAELLLKRTTATAAARVYSDFLERFPSVRALDSADEKDLEQALATVGLQKQRGRGLKAAARHLVEEHGAEIPTSADTLSRVPHLGPYATAAILSFAYGIPAAVLDSNVERILRRVFKDALPERPRVGLLQAVASALLPASRHREFNLGLLDLGALVCRYVRPRCGECPLLEICDYGKAEVSAEETVRPGGASRTPALTRREGVGQPAERLS